MGFRFKKSFNIGKFLRINLSKSGVGYSFGTRGFRISKTATGRTRKTVTLPGTGLSYQTESKTDKNNVIKDFTKGKTLNNTSFDDLVENVTNSFSENMNNNKDEK